MQMEEPDTQTVRALKGNAGWIFFFGVLLMLTGVFAMSAPFLAGELINFLVGGGLVAAGILELGHAFQTRRGDTLAWVVTGVLALAAGVLMIVRPVRGLQFLTLVLAIYFFVEGAARIVLAFRLRPLQGWVWSLFSGLLDVLLGALILWEWPFSGIWAVGVLVGINILFNGSRLVAFALAVWSEGGEGAGEGRRSHG